MSSNFVLFQNCFGYSSALAFSYKFWNQLISIKTSVEILSKIVWNLYINLQRSGELSKLSLPNHEYGTAFNLCRVFISQQCFVALSSRLCNRRKCINYLGLLKNVRDLQEELPPFNLR